VVSDDRADRLSTFTPPVPSTSTGEAVIGSHDARSASFSIGGFTLELVATDGTVTLNVVAGHDRDAYRLDAAVLDRWADGTSRLIGLSPASSPTATAEFRAPFLMDIEGRASVAFESSVTQGGVAHRLLLMRREGRVAAIATSADLLGELIDAARGAARFSRSGSSADGA
jgi:hypothetical protein